MRYNQNITATLASMVLLTASLHTGASVITDTSGRSVLFKAVDGTVDRLIAAPANHSHISFNALRNFKVDTNLQVFNLPSGAAPAADTIILYTDEASLAGHIEIIGPPSDLVILVKARVGEIETLNCNHCEFTNVNRVTLAIVKPEVMDVSSEMAELGNLASVANSTISVTSLDAPGALSLEILAEKLNLSGEINLNQTVRSDSSSVYAKDINGAKSVGSGAVNLYLGWSTWNYEQREIIGVLPGAPKILSLNGNISAPSVRVASSFPLVVNTRIDSRTDLLSTIMYQGALVAVDENIVLESIGDNVPLTLNGQFYSEGALDARASSDVVVNSSAHVSAQEIRIIAANKLLNDGHLNATDLYVAANEVENEGSMQSKGQVYAVAENYLVNQYGGVIRANEVRLESKNGVIRNGSKTPYKSSAGTNTGLLNYRSDYISTLSDVAMGAFYQPGVNVNTTNTNYVMAADNSANIIANTIEIKSAAFENINPYYVFVDVAGQAAISLRRANQILVSAEQSLAIDASNYVLNSSAQMIVNSEQGALSLKTTLLNNERYRVETTLSKAVTTSEDEGYFGPVDVTTDSLGVSVGVYSPPGRLISMGDLRIRASQSILNNTAYVEVFGDAYVDTPTVSSLGVILHRLSQDTNSFSAPCFGFYSSGFSGSACGYSYAEQVLVDGRQLDTLFFVQGAFNAADSLGWYSNHKPINTYAANTAEMLAAENLGLVLDTVRIRRGTRVFELDDSYTQSLVGENLETLQIKWANEKFVEASLDPTEPEPAYTYFRTGTTTFDFKEQLERYYTRFKQLFARLYDEINFWD